MKIGHTYVDVITNFGGICIGVAHYMTGCSQALLQPQSAGGEPVSKRPESEWFDIQRLLEVEGGPKIALDNGATPGPDKPAPKC